MIKVSSFIYIKMLRLYGHKIHSTVKIWPFSFISRGFRDGKKGSIDIDGGGEISQGAILKAYGGRIKLYKNVFLGEYITIYGHGGVEIGENTLVAMHTCIVSSNHTVPNADRLIRSEPDILLPVKIGKDVWIGAGVKILAGVTIGDGSVIGAGAVVSKSLPPYSVSVGNPAKVIRYRK